MAQVRSDGAGRTITFQVDSGAYVTAAPSDHSAARVYNTHKDSDSGLSYGAVTEGANTILGQGARVLHAKIKEDEPPI